MEEKKKSCNYSKKFIGVFNSLEFDDFVVDARNVELSKAIDQTLLCLIKYEKVKSDLELSVNHAKDKINKSFDKILEMI